MNVDTINGTFELVGAMMVWLNVRRLWRDQSVKGVSWWAQTFFAAWGWWNMIYYTALDQWWSFLAGCLLTGGTTLWVVLALGLRIRGLRSKQDHLLRRCWFCNREVGVVAWFTHSGQPCCGNCYELWLEYQKMDARYQNMSVEQWASRKRVPPKSGREAFENYQRNTGGKRKWNQIAATQRMAWFDMIDRPLLAKANTCECPHPPNRTSEIWDGCPVHGFKYPE